MNDQLLAEYEVLYKLAYADVAPLFPQEKTAIRRFLPGSAARVKKMVKGLDDAPIFTGRKNISDLEALDAQRVMRMPDVPPGGAGAQRGAAKAAPQAAAPQAAAPQAAARQAPTPEAAAAKPKPTAQQADDAGEAAGEAVEEGAEEVAQQGGRNPLLTAGLLGGTGGGAYLYGQHRGDEEARRKRNLAFGAGLATGTVAPQVIKRVGGVLNTIGGGYGPPPGMGGY